jgi:hypothetical protein
LSSAGSATACCAVVQLVVLHPATILPFLVCCPPAPPRARAHAPPLSCVTEQR